MIIESGSLAPFLRALGFIAIFPCGYDLVGVPRRIGIALLGALLILESGADPPSELGVVQGASEFLFGLLLALPLACVVEGGAVLGELLDAARGESLGSLYDPSFGYNSPLGAMIRNLVWGSVVISGAIVATAEIVVSSVHEVPLGVGIGLREIGEGMLATGSALFGVAVRCAAPWVGFFLVVECAGIVVLRLLPQLSLSSELFLAKTGGVVVLFWLVDGGLIGERLIGIVEAGYQSAGGR